MKEKFVRKLVQIVLGFLLGRVNLFGMNPIGIAFFAAGYTEDGAKIPVAISVILGMITVFPIQNVLYSATAMLAVMLAIDLLEKRNQTVQMGHAAFILCFAVGVITAIRLYILPHNNMDLWKGMLETILALAATRLLYEGIHFLLHAQKGQGPGNEEIISLVLIGAFGIIGLPNIKIIEISLILVIVYLTTLFMGYVYGTGAGAITGCAGGCVLTVFGWDSSMIGIIALVGICFGMLREQGKLLLSAEYFLIAVVLCYLVDHKMMVFEDMEGIAIAGGIFLLLPDKMLAHIKNYACSGEENWESENLQNLMKYKLKDFSNSFQKISSILSNGSQNKMMMNQGEIHKMLDMMNEQVCARCENGENCRGQLALFQPDMLGKISIAQKQGKIALEQMPVDFARECIHQERFLSEANQSIHIANMVLGFKNQMMQNQQIIAEQMKEIGEIVEELSEKLPNVQKVPQELIKKLEHALKKKRVLVKDIAFYEKFDGRVEIHIKGRTCRGRYVTTREVAQIISEVQGKEVHPLEECRKVFSRVDEEFVFEEGVKLKAITGVGRLNKEGEEISGDTFSCTYLPGGELMMALSDGMGSGDSACEESEQVIELLEQMTEAGFSENAALKLINSIYMSKEETRSFATADIAVLNLYKGNCQFIKCGASSTYLFHNQEIVRIEGQALPIGVMNSIEPYMSKSGIDVGDYVIMMTDGVADSFVTEEYELENLLYEYIEEKMAPQDMADMLLEEAVERWGGEAGDDMSVLVVKIYDNRLSDHFIWWKK